MTNSASSQPKSPPPRRSTLKRLTAGRAIGLLCLIAAAGLLALNITGMIIPLRNPDIYNEPLNYFTNDITLTCDEFWNRVGFRADEPRSNYVMRVTEAVSDGLAHLQIDDPKILKKYHRQLPIWENYVLWASRYGVYMKRWLSGTLGNGGSSHIYVFADYRKIAKRGVGLCAQHSFLATGILQDAGVPARIVGFGNHAVVEAEVEPGVWWTLDPDFGVVVPYDIATIVQKPELAEPYFIAKGHQTRWDSEFRAIYSAPPVAVFGSTREAQGTARYYFEFISYWLIWIIPAVLFLLGLVCLRHNKRNSTH